MRSLGGLKRKAVKQSQLSPYARWAAFEELSRKAYPGYPRGRSESPSLTTRQMEKSGRARRKQISAGELKRQQRYVSSGKAKKERLSFEEQMRKLGTPVPKKG